MLNLNIGHRLIQSSLLTLTENWHCWEPCYRHLYRKYLVQPTKNYDVDTSACKFQVRRSRRRKSPSKWLNSMDTGVDDFPIDHSLISSWPNGFLDLGLARSWCPPEKRAGCRDSPHSIQCSQGHRVKRPCIPVSALSWTRESEVPSPSGPENPHL